MKILVFDDEKDVCFLYKLILKQKGHQVETRTDASRLLEDVKDVKPDVIFMDNSMPGVTGYEATLTLKQQEGYNDIPVIFCSANWNADYLAKAAQADYFLPKPFSVNDIEQSLKIVQNRAA